MKEHRMENITARLVQVFWGLAMVAVDFRLGRFDVIADFLGYAVIALGVGGLAGWSRHLQTARVLGWVLVPVSAALLVTEGGVLKVVWIVSLVLDGALIWFLLGGIMEFAASRGRSEWVSRASLCRRAYVGLAAIALVISWIAPVLTTLARVLGSVTLVASWILVAAILYLVHQVKGEAAVDPPAEEFKEAA